MDFVLNGRRIGLSLTNPQTTLLDWLRQEGLTGAKEGCAEGECGACTVLLVREHPQGSQYVPVNSCLLFLPMVAGQEIVTVEGLRQDGRLCEAQRAIADGGGSQCGYCTPGFVMSLFAEQYRPGRSTLCDPHSMGGNLCRCTGYRPLSDAALSLAPAPDDSFRARLSAPPPILHAVHHEHRGVRFDRPASLPECLDLLAAHPAARLVAGATDLAVDSNLKDHRWPHLVSVEALPELRTFRDTPEFVELGAGLTLSEIEARWTGAPSLVHDWFPLFASPLIRNRATLGGNLATASPIGDGAPMLLGLGADLKIAGPLGERRVPLADFFLAYRRTALMEGELIVSVVIPKPFPALARFFKVAKRRMDDISTVAACFAIDLDAADRVTAARIAFGGVAATPIRVKTAEQFLIGRKWDEHSVRETREIIGESLTPLSDHRGSAAYRLAVAETLLEKFRCEREEELQPV